MIVKVVLNPELKDFSIYKEGGERIYYSDIEGEYDFLDKLIMEKQNIKYFQAHWEKRKVKITKMVTGYTF